MGQGNEVNGQVERQISPGVIANLKPFDDCCWRLSITRKGKEIKSGIWCPRTHILAIDGSIAGFAPTKEDVLERLRQYKVYRWGLT